MQDIFMTNILAQPVRSDGHLAHSSLHGQVTI